MITPTEWFANPPPLHKTPPLDVNTTQPRSTNNPTQTNHHSSTTQRLKEMKQLTKDTGGQLKPNKASNNSSEIQSMSLNTTTSGAPKKKPVFKAIGSSSSSNAAVAGTTPASLAGGGLDVSDPSTATEENDPSGAVRNGYDLNPSLTCGKTFD